MYDVIIANATVIDGTGAEAYEADVAIARGRIDAVGELDGAVARHTVNAAGRVLCPGFVDVHSHSDLTLLSSPLAHSAVRQGITTQVVGNCGLGVAPLPEGADVAAIRSAVSYLDLDPTVEWTWRDVPRYLESVRLARPSINVATLVPHLPLRAGVVGFEDRQPTASELDTMCGLVDDALNAGAVGLSTGLMYAPLCFAGTEELEALARVVAEHDAVFAWHLRDYGDDVVDAVREALGVATATGCRTQISHLTAVGQRNWGAAIEALALVDDAREAGVDVGVDMYPYLAGNAPLSQRLPAWAVAGGEQEMRSRLGDPDSVAAIRRGWVDLAVGWDEITINGAPDVAVVGHTVMRLAAQRGIDADEVAIDLLARFGNSVTMVAGGRDAGDLEAVLTHAATVVGSDGQALDDEGPTGVGMPHPRSYGSYPRMLQEYAEPGPLSLPEAIHKCTGAAAARVGIVDRGVIEPGRAADLVVLDLERLADNATFVLPRAYPSGIDVVLVNGEITVHDGQHTGAREGRPLTAGEVAGEHAVTSAAVAQR